MNKWKWFYLGVAVVGLVAAVYSLCCVALAKCNRTDALVCMGVCMNVCMFALSRADLEDRFDEDDEE